MRSAIVLLCLEPLSASAAKVELGNEVFIEREDHWTLAVLKQPQLVGRKISDCLALAKRRTILNSATRPYPMPTFVEDVEGHRRTP